MASIDLHGVSRVFPDGRTGVRDLSLTIADGELLVLVGPSGSGKSTALRLIAGLDSPTAGQILIDGRDVTGVPPQDRDLAMVFQSYALYPHMTVRENLAFGLRMRRTSPAVIAARVGQTADVLGLAPLLDRKPAQLSGGERQRVALGRAIVREPKAFLLDEPLSNLDPLLRASTRAELALLHRRLAATMIYVTHDQVEAMTMGDRIVVLNAGRVQQIDTPLGLYRRPVNRFVAGFIGSPAMNFFPGTLTRADGLRFVGDDAGPVFRVPDAWARVLDGKERKVVAGIRPEDIEVGSGAVDGVHRAPVRVRLDAVEPMGNETFLHARTGGQDLTARVAPADLPTPGAEVELGLDLGKLHLFESETDMRIEV